MTHSYTYEWVMSHSGMSHVTHFWDVPHDSWLIHTLMNELCHTQEYVMSHICDKTQFLHVCHFTYNLMACKHIYFTKVNQLCYSYEWDLAHIWMRLNTHMNVYELSLVTSRVWTCVTHMNETSCHTYVTRLNSYTWYDSCIRVTWRIHISDAIHSGTWHASFICETWLIICVTWLIHMCDMNHSYEGYDSLI